MAASLALFNNAARYLYALARDGVLPVYLSGTHPRHESPHRAVMVLCLLVVAVFVVSALARLDPLLNVSTALVGVGSVGLMALLAMTSLGIPVFFAKRAEWGWGTTVAPVVGGVIIAVATLLAVLNYPALTGVPSGIINYLLVLVVIAAAAGIIQARWLNRHNPAIYRQIGSNRVG